MKFKLSVLLSIGLIFFVVGFQSNCDKKTAVVSDVKVTPVDTSLLQYEHLNHHLSQFGY